MIHLIRKYLQTFRFNLHGALMESRLQAYAPMINGKLVDVGAGDSPYRGSFEVDEYIATNSRSHYPSGHAIEQYTDIWIEDASSLPFDDSSIDAVTCFQVISVLEDPTAFFREAHRILKPGGKLLISTDWLFPTWSVEDKRRYSKAELTRMLEKSGMMGVVVESLGAQRSLMYMLANRWITGYPERIQKVVGAQKILRMMYYLWLLLSLPLLSIYGCWAYLIERDVNDSCGQTYAFLVIAEK